MQIFLCCSSVSGEGGEGARGMGEGEWDRQPAKAYSQPARGPI